ncbi:metallophosphoesterase family protein [Romboutsia maritimum]|uniref:hypothetical protein n=1 Tax=Romboutsia maritimum TaxID=2020948 RepID=UPI001FB19DBE|nr:hypothetical protein [Romboutsia maritimum]
MNDLVEDANKWVNVMKKDKADVIVEGHNHEQIEQHDYKNKSGKKVIVTEPGNNGECISNINFKLEKDDNGWNVVDKSSKITQFEKSKKERIQGVDNYGKLMCELEFLDDKTKEISL